jgi:hypothetical protein
MEIKEEQIRPAKIFDEYLKLTEIDIKTYFSNVKFEEINCPVCASKGSKWINKSGFNYNMCPNCLSIYVNPRPEINAFNEYYTDSPSTKYWATTFYKETENSRRELLWKPKAKLIKDIIVNNEFGGNIEYIIDIGGGYGVFDEEIEKIMDIKTIIIEPSLHLAKICRSKGLNVIEKFMEKVEDIDLPSARKCFVSFELFEHLHDPNFFLSTVFDCMKSNDIFVFTTLNGMGLDIQLLREHSKALSPPHHLNFFNPNSMAEILKKHGFEIIEVNTPGKLDIDILFKNKTLIKDPYWINLLKLFEKEDLNKLQKSISDMGLSSHMMISAKKK